jgi:hypothetical protein
MNTTSRAILQTVLATDVSLSTSERGTVEGLIDGKIAMPTGGEASTDSALLVTQKRAAELLSVCRATIWRMTKDCVLHPVEITPGIWRYPLREIVTLSQTGAAGVLLPPKTRREKTAA